MYFGGNSESLEYKSRAWYQREESRVSSVEICEGVNEFNMLRKSLKVDTEGGRKPGIFVTSVDTRERVEEKTNEKGRKFNHMIDGGWEKPVKKVFFINLHHWIF